jgi:hypothetical protein
MSGQSPSPTIAPQRRTAALVSSVKRYPFVPWDRLKPHFAAGWKQGKHVLTVGGTGSGKSTLAGEMLPRRALVVVCVSKGMDEIFEGPYYSDYETIQKWPPKKEQQRVLLRPANGKSIAETRVNKQGVFRKMFDDVLLHRGHWCIDVDEEHYMCESLKLEQEVTDILEQGRSAGISMWNNTQRPSGIPLATYINSSFAAFFRTQEEYDVKRIGKMRNKHTTPIELMANVERLDDHEFVFSDASGRIPPCRSIVVVKGSRKRASS